MGSYLPIKDWNGVDGKGWERTGEEWMGMDRRGKLITKFEWRVK